MSGGFGTRVVLAPERDRVGAVLRRDMVAGTIAERSGPGGKKVKYIEHQVACNLANKHFGYCGWSSVVVGSEFVFVGENAHGKWDVFCKVHSYVELENGARHADFGWGEASNMPHRGGAMEKALKTATSDARKRCLRIFGAALGGSLYDKSFLSGKKRVLTEDEEDEEAARAAEACHY